MTEEERRLVEEGRVVALRREKRRIQWYHVAIGIGGLILAHVGYRICEDPELREVVKEVLKER